MALDWRERFSIHCTVGLKLNAQRPNDVLLVTLTAPRVGRILAALGVKHIVPSYMVGAHYDAPGGAAGETIHATHCVAGVMEPALAPAVTGSISGCAYSTDVISCAHAPLDGTAFLDLQLAGNAIMLHSINTLTTAALSGKLGFSLLGGATATLNPETQIAYTGPSLQAALVPDGNCGLYSLCTASFSLASVTFNVLSQANYTSSGIVSLALLAMGYPASGDNIAVSKMISGSLHGTAFYMPNATGVNADASRWRCDLTLQVSYADQAEGQSVTARAEVNLTQASLSWFWPMPPTPPLPLTPPPLPPLAPSPLVPPPSLPPLPPTPSPSHPPLPPWPPMPPCYPPHPPGMAPRPPPPSSPTPSRTPWPSPSVPLHPAPPPPGPATGPTHGAHIFPSPSSVHPGEIAAPSLAGLSILSLAWYLCRWRQTQMAERRMRLIAMSRVGEELATGKGDPAVQDGAADMHSNAI